MTSGAREEPYVVVSLPPGRTAAWLAAIAAVLVAVHDLLQSFHYLVRPLPWLLLTLFDVDAEDSLPTWFNAALLLLAAALCGLVALRTARARGPWLAHWRGLAAGFVLLSIDEIAGLHETLNTVIPFSWTLPGLGVALVAGLFFIPFLRALPRGTAMLMAAAGGLYLAGALGVEWATESWYAGQGPDNLAYNLFNAAEEGLEMGGLILFTYAVLGHMAPTTPATGVGVAVPR